MSSDHGVCADVGAWCGCDVDEDLDALYEARRAMLRGQALPPAEEAPVELGKAIGGVEESSWGYLSDLCAVHVDFKIDDLVSARRKAFLEALKERRKFAESLFVTGADGKVVPFETPDMSLEAICEAFWVSLPPGWRFQDEPLVVDSIPPSEKAVRTEIRVLPEPTASEKLVRALADINPSAMLIEPRGVFDPCVVALMARPVDHWGRKTDAVVAVYSSSKVLMALMKENGCGLEEALEHYDHNVAGGWVGDGTPAFTWDIDLASGVEEREDGPREVLGDEVEELLERNHRGVVGRKGIGDEDWEN